MNRLRNVTILSLIGYLLLFSPGCGSTDPPQPETLQKEPPTTEKLSPRQRAQQVPMPLVRDQIRYIDHKETVSARARARE